MENLEPTPEPTIEPTPQPEPTSTTESFLTDEGTFSESYLNSLPDDLGKHSIFAKYNNPLDMVKGTINAQSLAGKKAEDFWTSEDSDIVSKRKEIMGVPKDVDGYEIDMEGLPEEYAGKFKEGADEFKKMALEKGWPKSMVEDALAFDKQRGIAAYQQMQDGNETSIRETEEILKAEWKGDKYEYNISQVSEAMDFLGLGEFKDNPKYANDPNFIKAIHEKIVPLIANDTIIEARQKESFASISDTLTELDSKMYAYTGHTNDPSYQNMVKQRGDLLGKLQRK